VSRGGIEHRAARISVVTGLSTLLSVAFQVVAVPICLKYWGKETYGSWLALYAAFMLVRSLDAGFISYVGNELNCLFHSDLNALREHLASSISGIAIIVAIQLSIGLAAIFSDGMVRLLGVSTGTVGDYRASVALFVLIGTWALTGSYLGIVHRLLIPAGLMYEAAWWSMGFQVSQFAAIILAAMRGFNVLQTSILFALVQLFIYVASAVYIRRILPTYFPWWKGGRARTGIIDLSRSLFLTASNLIQQGSTNGTILLISFFSGPAAVPVFTTLRTMANLWTNVTNVLTTPLLPEIIRYHATGEARKLGATCDAYWVLVGNAVNLGVLLSYPLIRPLYGFWTARAVSLNEPLLCLLLGSVVLNNVGALISLYLNGTNSLGIVLRTAVARSALSVIFGGILFFRLGLVGFGVGILCGELVALVMMGNHFVKSVLHRQDVFLSIRSLASITISTTLVVLFLLSSSAGLSIGPYLYALAVLGVVTAALVGWHGLDHNVRTRLARMVGNRFVDIT
jgi:O-antigen/teichoic acid export membrane protein